MLVRCITADPYDGCIFKSQSDGAIAFLESGSDTLETYRLTETEFKTVFIDASFTTDQATTYNVATLNNAKVVQNDPAVALQYMDYA